MILEVDDSAGCRRASGQQSPHFPLFSLMPREVLLARITVEDCLARIGNQFGLVILGALRAHQIKRGARPLVDCANKAAVIALREIAAGEVKFDGDLRAAIEEHIRETKEKELVQAATKSRELVVAKIPPPRWTPPRGDQPLPPESSGFRSSLITGVGTP